MSNHIRPNFYLRLAASILEVLDRSSEWLREENRRISQDTDYTVEQDFSFVRRYLADYESTLNHGLRELKPKGNVFIVLSYNEPAILSVVPILNALAAGNSLRVRPSRRCVSFFRKLWFDSGLVSKHSLPLELVETREDGGFREKVAGSDCVCFFGSHENSLKVGVLCAELGVEYVPEVETADCKVFMHGSVNSEVIIKDAELTLKESFTHAGQTCHRVAGLLVQNDSYGQYISAIKSLLASQSFSHLVKESMSFPDEYLSKINRDIEESYPKHIAQAYNSPAKVVLGPSLESRFVKEGYFYPVLWVAPFQGLEDLTAHLNSRKYFLGLNISASDQGFIERVIGSTFFTRYTVNRSHVDIGSGEGWGGRWPSGVGGYKGWIEHFSNRYTILL